MFEKIWAYFFGPPEKILRLPRQPSTKIRKRRDTTRWTKQHHDYIQDRLEYRNGLNRAGNTHYTQDWFTDLINRELGLDKSKASIMRLANNKTTRRDLPHGPQLEIFETYNDEA